MILFIIMLFIAALLYCDHEEKKTQKTYMCIVKGFYTNDFVPCETLWISMEDYYALTNVNPNG